ncbi:MAG: methyltransferase, partial [Nitrosospira sp.]
MENRILTSNYVFDIQKNIWSRPGYTGISYSDGDEAELHIARIIEQADDISVLSTELRQHCTDWPTLYHLSGTRANILRPFASALIGDILEIGAGCGAITRYLGESGANILALEGSQRRAAIARSRTRDLKNVMVLAEKFDQFQSNHRFDMITLIGVLEYANLFMANDNPALTMLKCARSLLKPDGKLIIAIENQLGLKYFAGSPEDHLGRPMYGIEGRYRKDQPQTFGRATLANLLTESGFSTAEFLAPFPDYKLPISILTAEGISNKRFDGAALAWQSVRRDPQLPASTNFLLELAWPEVFKNGLALEMTNSFLIVASPFKQQIVKSGILGYHYSTDRAPQYCKETVFEYINENKIVVSYHALSGRKSDINIREIINFECPTSAIYTEGTPLSLEFIKIVTREGWSIDEVGSFIQRYINFLSLIADQTGNSVRMSLLVDRLPGYFFDMVPQNIIVNHSGQPVVIDTEWTLNDDIELGFLLFRSLLWAMGSVVSFGRNSTSQAFSRRYFVKSALDAAGFSITDEDFRRFIELESIVQQQVTERTSKELLYSWVEQMLPVSSTFEYDNRAANLSQILAERNQQIVDLNQTLIKYNICIEKLKFEPGSIIPQETSEHALQELSDSRSEQMSQAFVTECERRIANFNRILTDRNQQIANLNQTLVEYKTCIERLQCQITEIHASTSWRLSSPLRATKSILMTSGIYAKPEAPTGIRHAGGFNNLLRRIYKYLPLSLAYKQRLRQIYLHQAGFSNQSGNPHQPDIVSIANDDTLQRDQNRDALPLMAASAKQFDPSD